MRNAECNCRGRARDSRAGEGDPPSWIAFGRIRAKCDRWLWEDDARCPRHLRRVAASSMRVACASEPREARPKRKNAERVHTFGIFRVSKQTKTELCATVSILSEPWFLSIPESHGMPLNLASKDARATLTV
jgi:hypothetical protein